MWKRLAALSKATPLQALRESKADLDEGLLLLAPSVQTSARLAMSPSVMMRASSRWRRDSGTGDRRGQRRGIDPFEPASNRGS